MKTLNPTPTIAIRPASPADTRTIMRLAALDSAPVPFGPTLLAEIDGEPRAAIALRDGAVVADPFHRTADLVALLDVRAALLRGASTQMVRGPSLMDRARHAIAA